ncbi:hypothetical protein CAter282_0227 [Collimonas arenae]|uniref:Uncharacterized protein n=1 Tax=Collimonas arenae TaxID=279058 RepID=A0A127PK44_9BURK|nr:hypothetical protein CAter10_0240 [Collimonas arenae]AMP08049.1 hypothetical protein CAter282_0227 [Collimonas arenae]
MANAAAGLSKGFIFILVYVVCLPAHHGDPSSAVRPTATNS